MSSEYPKSGNEAFQVLTELEQHRSVMGQPYNNIALTTDNPDFVDTYDPDMAHDTEVLTLHWPGGDPVHARILETIRIHRQELPDAEFAQEVITIRTAILGATVSRAALDRVPQGVKDIWEVYKALYQVPILYARDLCAVLGIPLAVCQTNRVIESEVIPLGKRIMHLWYPSYVSPKPVLATLKKVVRDMVAEETI